MALNTFTKISTLPQVATSRVRELQWGIDWWAKCYGESALQEKLAWKIYDDAIENRDPQAQIDALFAVAKMFEANRIAAYHQWQECKRQYLEMMN